MGKLTPEDAVSQSMSMFSDLEIDLKALSERVRELEKELRLVCPVCNCEVITCRQDKIDAKLEARLEKLENKHPDGRNDIINERLHALEEPDSIPIGGYSLRQLQVKFAKLDLTFEDRVQRVMDIVNRERPYVPQWRRDPDFFKKSDYWMPSDPEQVAPNKAAKRRAEMLREIQQAAKPPLPRHEPENDQLTPERGSTMAKRPPPLQTAMKSSEPPIKGYYALQELLKLWSEYLEELADRLEKKAQED